MVCLSVFVHHVRERCSSSRPIDSIWAVKIVWRLGWKNNQNCSVLCCVQQLCTMIHTHTHVKSSYIQSISRQCCITAKLIKMTFGGMTWVGPRNHVLDGVQIPHGKGQFSGGCLGHWKALYITAVYTGAKQISNSVSATFIAHCFATVKIFWPLVILCV